MLRSLTRHAQVAFEFVVLVAIVFTALIVFTAFVRDNFRDVQSDTDYFKLKDVALSVKAEISLAVALEDGYQRAFFLPLTIDGLEYNISRENGFLMFESSGAEYTVSVPSYSGDVQKGNNIIRKVDGVIEVNV
jgi:type II secretory pathway component PulC